MKFEDEGANVQKGDEKIERNQGAARAISVCTQHRCANLSLTTLQSFIDPGLCWKDIDWFKSITNSVFTNIYHSCILFFITMDSAYHTEGRAMLGSKYGS